MKKQPSPPTAEELERQVRELSAALYLFTGRNFFQAAYLAEQQAWFEQSQQLANAIKIVGISPHREN